ncbi:hypothetical protein [Bartonella tamiae]|nr:hypothetical protein [Bartonella tamiae]
MPKSAEYWEGSGALQSMFKMAWAYISDDHPHLGKKGEVRL